jgi:hypothetical protein
MTNICLGAIFYDIDEKKIINILESTVNFIKRYIIYIFYNEQLKSNIIDFYKKNSISGDIILISDNTNISIIEIRKEIMKKSYSNKFNDYTFFLEPYSDIQINTSFDINKLIDPVYHIPHFENDISYSIPCLIKNSSITNINNFSIKLCFEKKYIANILKKITTKSFLKKKQMQLKYEKYIEYEINDSNKIIYYKLLNDFNNMYKYLIKYFKNNNEYSWEINYLFALYFFKQDNYKVSLEWLKRCNTNRPEIYYLFSKIYYYNKQYDDSMKYLLEFFNLNNMDFLIDYHSKKIYKSHHISFLSDYENIIFYINFQLILLFLQKNKIINSIDKCHSLLKNIINKKNISIIINFCKIKLKPLYDVYCQFNNINGISENDVLFNGDSISISNVKILTDKFNCNKNTDNKILSFNEKIKNKFKFFSNSIKPIYINDRGDLITLGSFLNNKKIYNFIYSYKNKLYLSYPITLELVSIYGINKNNSDFYILGYNHSYKFVIYKIPLKELYINYNIPLSFKQNIIMNISKNIKLSLITNNYNFNNNKFNNYIITQNPNENKVKHRFVLDFNSFIINYKNYLKKIREFIYLPSKNKPDINKQYDITFYKNCNTPLQQYIVENINMSNEDKNCNLNFVISPYHTIKYIKQSKYLFINNEDFQNFNTLDLSKIIENKTIIINLIDEKSIQNKLFEYNTFIKNDLLNQNFLFNIALNKSYKSYIFENILIKNVYLNRQDLLDKDLESIYNSYNIVKYCIKNKNIISKDLKKKVKLNNEQINLYEKYIEKYKLNNNTFFPEIIKRIIFKKYNCNIFCIFNSEEIKNKMLLICNNLLKINLLGQFNFIDASKLNNYQDIINTLDIKNDNIYITENLNISLKIDHYLKNNSIVFISSDNILYHI